MYVIPFFSFLFALLLINHSPVLVNDRVEKHKSSHHHIISSRVIVKGNKGVRAIHQGVNFTLFQDVSPLLGKTRSGV